jgi:hypothetical protein
MNRDIDLAIVVLMILTLTVEIIKLATRK